MGAYLQFDSNFEWYTTCGLGTMNKRAAVAVLILPNYSAFCQPDLGSQVFSKPPTPSQIQLYLLSPLFVPSFSFSRSQLSKSKSLLWAMDEYWMQSTIELCLFVRVSISVVWALIICPWPLLNDIPPFGWPHQGPSPRTHWSKSQSLRSSQRRAANLS